MVDVTAAVELDDIGQGDLGSNVSDRLGLFDLLEGGIVGIDVGLMVLGVVDLVNLAGNEGLEGAKVVVQFGEGSLASGKDSRHGGSSGKSASDSRASN